MDKFSFGIWSLIGLFAFPCLWFASFQLRKLSKWVVREEGPKDRVAVFLVCAAIFGLIAGSFVQHLADRSEYCKSIGTPGLFCIMT